jgi:hypothetical protein
MDLKRLPEPTGPGRWAHYEVDQNPCVYEVAKVVREASGKAIIHFVPDGTYMLIQASMEAVPSGLPGQTVDLAFLQVKRAPGGGAVTIEKDTPEEDWALLPTDFNEDSEAAWREVYPEWFGWVDHDDAIANGALPWTNLS